MAPGKGTYRSAEPLRRNGSNRSEADTNGQEATDEPTYPVPGAGDGWAEDPFGRYARREYHNGVWTDLVAKDAETVLKDPPRHLAPIPPPPSA